MSYISDLFKQPSTYAGLGLLSQVIPTLLAAPANPLGWAGLFTALAAILRNEANYV